MGELCCILGVCCPPESAQSVEALARFIEKETKCKPSEAMAMASLMKKHFAIAPKSLEPLIADVAKMAKS